MRHCAAHRHPRQRSLSQRLSGTSRLATSVTGAARAPRPPPPAITRRLCTCAPPVCTLCTVHQVRERQRGQSGRTEHRQGRVSIPAIYTMLPRHGALRRGPGDCKRSGATLSGLPRRGAGPGRHGGGPGRHGGAPG